MPRFDSDNKSLYLLTAYKLAGIFAGLAFGFMGYRLFMAGVFEHAGNLEALFGKEHLILKAAAPGTFFAVLGCVIVVATIWRGLKFTEDQKGKGHRKYWKGFAGASVSEHTLSLAGAPIVDEPIFRAEGHLDMRGAPDIPTDPPVYKTVPDPPVHKKD